MADTTLFQKRVGITHFPISIGRCDVAIYSRTLHTLTYAIYYSIILLVATFILQAYIQLIYDNVYDEVAVRRIYVLHGDAAIRCVDATTDFNSVYLFAITDYVMLRTIYLFSTSIMY